MPELEPRPVSGSRLAANIVALIVAVEVFFFASPRVFASPRLLHGQDRPDVLASDIAPATARKLPTKGFGTGGAVLASGLALVLAAAGRARFAASRRFATGRRSLPVLASVAPAEATLASGTVPGADPLLPASAGLPKARDVRRFLLMPNVVKWKKPHRPKIRPKRSTKYKYKGDALKGITPYYGKYGLAVWENAWISSKQIEAARRTIVRALARRGALFIKVYPDRGITHRTPESRLGGGKGSIHHWVSAVKPKFILFEVDGVPIDVARLAFKKAAFNLPVECRFVEKMDGPSQYELGVVTGRGGKSPNDPRIQEQRALEEGGGEAAPDAPEFAKK